MFEGIGSTELILVLLVVLLLFGGKKIPELLKGLGEAARNFRDVVKDSDEKEKD